MSVEQDLNGIAESLNLRYYECYDIDKMVFKVIFVDRDGNQIDVIDIDPFNYNHAITGNEIYKRLSSLLKSNNSANQIKKLDEVNTAIMSLTGHDIFELRKMFAAGWKLTPPDYGHISMEEFAKSLGK